MSSKSQMTLAPESPTLSEVKASSLAIGNMLEQACTNPDFDADKLQKFMEIKDRHDAKIASERFHAALSAFQGECPRIQKVRQIKTKSGSIPYAAYEDLMAVCQPLLTKHGLAVSFDTRSDSPTSLTTVCRVSGYGHSTENEITLPVPNLHANDTQKMGAASSFGKRYSLQNALNIVVVGEDVDASILTGIVEYVSDGQVQALEDILDDIERLDKPGATGRFYKHLEKTVGCDSFTALPAPKFDEVMKMLKQKKASLEIKKEGASK